MLMTILLNVRVSHTLGSKVTVTLNGGLGGVGVVEEDVGTLVGRVPGDKYSARHHKWTIVAVCRYQR